ncbi:hypothetical protein [Labrys wisconsinensis]|uniref:Uncharacterized protein n=1 Tax=Labrys wisconsinensis TaxID=425677 RepID=A0ABU0JMG2_9HYPH|nr:hypothetical protein [Labrys wisconsinensis]MDQ0475459.1 hypothetical protein [Labrys wisconsinensis]
MTAPRLPTPLPSRLAPASRVTLHVFRLELATIALLANFGPKGWPATAALLLAVCALVHSAVATALEQPIDRPSFTDWDCASWLAALAFACLML